MGRRFRVNAEWDDQASVWVATSPDVLGLVTEGRNYDAIIRSVRLIIPALVEIGVEPEDVIEVKFLGEKVVSVPLAA